MPAQKVELTPHVVPSYRGWLNADNLDKFTLLCLLLMPIFSLSIRHWLSGWFSLLALVSLLTLYRSIHQPLQKEEKLLFLIFLGLLTSFILSATLNEWTASSVRRIGTEFKYLMFFPLYLLIRRSDKALHFFMAGITIGAIVLGLQAIYDTLFTDKGRGAGIYGPIVFGDLSILFFCVNLLLLTLTKKQKSFTLLLVISLVMSGLATYLSGNRNAWLAAILLLLLIPFLLSGRFQLRYIISIYVGILAIILIFSFSFNTSISNRAERALTEFSNYFSIYKTPHFKQYDLLGDSVGFRLEQWRVALIVFRDAPWFGHGAGNAARVENEYVKQGIGHPDLYNPKSYTNIGGLHSTYFETLVNEGLVGLIIMLLFLGYPIFVFIRLRRYNVLISSLGIVFMLSYTIFGLTENPFVHDNFSSFYLTCLSVLFSAMLRARKEQTTHNDSV